MNNIFETNYLSAAISQYNILVDRVYGEDLSLPYDANDIIVHPNTLVTADNINASIQKLYVNFLQIVSRAKISGNNIPVTYNGVLDLSGTYANQLYGQTDIITTKYVSAIDGNIKGILASPSNIWFTDITYNTLSSISDVLTPNNGDLVQNQNTLSFNKIIDLDVDGDDMYVADVGASLIYKYDISGLTKSNNILMNKTTRGRMLVKSIGGPGQASSKNKFEKLQNINWHNGLLYVLDNGWVKVYDKQLNYQSGFDIQLDLRNKTVIDCKLHKQDMYILNSDGSLFVYDLTQLVPTYTEYQLLDIDFRFNDLNEQYKKLLFSKQNDNVLYILSTRNVYKKFVSKLIQTIGSFQYLDKKVPLDTLSLTTSTTNFTVPLLSSLSSWNSDLYTFAVNTLTINTTSQSTRLNETYSKYGLQLDIANYYDSVTDKDIVFNSTYKFGKDIIHTYSAPPISTTYTKFDPTNTISVTMRLDYAGSIDDVYDDWYRTHLYSFGPPYVSVLSYQSHLTSITATNLSQNFINGDEQKYTVGTIISSVSSPISGIVNVTSSFQVSFPGSNYQRGMHAEFSSVVSLLTTNYTTFLFEENENYIDMFNSQYQRYIYPLSSINVKPEEYVSSFAYNKSLYKLYYNHMLLVNNIKAKFTNEFDQDGNFRFPGLKYTTSDQLDLNKYKPSDNGYVGINEPVINSVINRCLNEVYNIQQSILKLLVEQKFSKSIREDTIVKLDQQTNTVSYILPSGNQKGTVVI